MYGNSKIANVGEEYVLYIKGWHYILLYHFEVEIAVYVSIISSPLWICTIIGHKSDL